MQVFAGNRITADLFNRQAVQMVAQSADQEVESSTTLVPTEVIIPVESGATYLFITVLSYSARNTNNDTEGGGLRWNWDVPTGTAMPRQTATYDLVSNSSISLVTGGRIILRSPAASTEMRADGSGSAAFHSALEYGNILVGGQSGECTLQFAQFNSHSTATVLRGALRTRAYFIRVQ